jgi:hypothetical protein
MVYQIESAVERQNMNKNRVIITAILVILAIYLVSSFLYPVSVYSDSAFGLFIWRSMLHGAPLTLWRRRIRLIGPSTIFTFQPWWSPGQYLVPGVISLTGLTPRAERSGSRWRSLRSLV